MHLNKMLETEAGQTDLRSEDYYSIMMYTHAELSLLYVLMGKGD